MTGDLSKYRRFIGREYEPPHGCLRLVEQVFSEVYGFELDRPDRDVEPNDGRGLYRLLDKLGKPVYPGYVEEGDVIVVRSRPWHIGVVVDPDQKWMLHSYRGGSACIQPYNTIEWENLIAGFFRYAGGQ